MHRAAIPVVLAAVAAGLALTSRPTAAARNRGTVACRTTPPASYSRRDTRPWELDADAVSLSAFDDAAGQHASGVAGVWTALEATQALARYRAPLTVPADASVLVWAVDRAGNRADADLDVAKLLKPARP